MFAGIWDYSDVKGETIPSFAILTDEPNELVAPYHDRMPVVLADVEPWLDLDTPLDDVRPLGPDRFVVRAVNPAVNKVSEKNIDAISVRREGSAVLVSPEPRSRPICWICDH
jgi:putative SOS response-associated peptidase YedK